MSRTPAAELSRLKVVYRRWDVRRAAETTGFTAERRDEAGGLRTIFAPTLPELEAALIKAEGET